EIVFRANSAGASLLLPSPANAFRLVLDDSYRTRAGPAQFLVSLSLLSVLGLGCLTLAIALLPCRWQDKDESLHAPEQTATRLRIRRLIRAPLLDANPFYWLASLGGTTNALLRVTVVVAILLWTTFYF